MSATSTPSLPRVAPRGAVHALFDLDPDLAEGIPAPEYEHARRRAVAHVLTVDESRWDVTEICEAADDHWFGLYVIDGLLVRQVTVASRRSCELFGAGDVIRPWDEDNVLDPLAVTVDWRLLQPARFAILNGDFAVRVARWPCIYAALLGRVATSPRHLAVCQAVTHLTRTNARLLLMFWLLAERWGKVVTDGVIIPLPLTHQLLATLVGNRRPTVTLALQKLNREDLLIRQSTERWLLTHKAIACLDHPECLAEDWNDHATG